MNSPPDVLIRPARADDEAVLAEIDATAWTSRSGFPSATPPARRSNPAFFDAHNPPAIHLIAEIDGAVVGYVRLKPPSSLPENAHVIQISGIAVSPAARRRGAATALIDAAQRRATAAAAHKLSLRVFSTNEPAIRLYDRLGFEREGVLREEFLIDGHYVDDVIMAKLLRPGR